MDASPSIVMRRFRRFRAFLATLRELGRRGRILPKVHSALTTRRRRRLQEEMLRELHPEHLSPAWFVQAEGRFAPHGVVHYRRDAAICDPRFTWEMARGADRMALSANGYAIPYSQILTEKHFTPKSILEIGILDGSGLAVWGEAFPNAKLFGIDFTFDPYLANLPKLLSLGAFARTSPQIYLMDVREPDIAKLQGLSACAGSIDLVIDDGPHTHEAIECMARALSPYLSPEFLYIIEDNPGCLSTARRLFGERALVFRQGGLVIVDGRS